MIDVIKKYNKITIASLITLLVIVMGLFVVSKKGTSNLTERDRRLVNYDQYQTGDELIDGTDYVTFDAYFYEKINGTATKIRGEYLNINDSAELWLDLHVFGEAELKNGKIELVNGNVKTSGYLYKSTIIPSTMSIPTNGGVINLNSSIKAATLNNKINITANLTNDLNSLSNSTNKIILTGTVVKPNGDEVEIRKEVNYTVDWSLDDIAVTIGRFAKSNQSFPYKQVYGCETQTLMWNVKSYYHEWTGENYRLTFNLTTTATSPFIKSANVEMKIPKLNGYDPISVNVSGGTFNYDPNTYTLTMQKEATLEGTLITQNAYSYRNNGISYNDWYITVEYPKEVEDNSATLLFNTKAWYEEYKYNENSQIEVVTSDTVSSILNALYEKPLIRQKHQVECGEPDRVQLNYKVTVGNYSSILRIRYINKTGALKKYKNEDGATEATSYSVNWETYLSYFDRYLSDEITKVTMSDVNADSASSKTLDGISKYKSIYVSRAGYWLGSSGYIKIIDNKTGEVIHVLTALDWDNTYTFDTDVSSIRLETSPLVNKDAMDYHATHYGWQDTNMLSLFSVSIRKEIDNNLLMDAYTLEEFNSMSYVSTNLNVSGIRHRTEENENQTISGSNDYSSASFRTMQSATVTIATDKSSIDSTKLTDVKFTIETGEFYDIVDGYKDAEFLLALPDWILDLDINSVTSTNNNVKITGYEKVDLGNGRKAIRIMTANDSPAKYKVEINAAIIPDARQMNKSGTLQLYATNPSSNLSERTAQDVFDVDQDGNTNEYQNYASRSISLIAPNEIITTTTINYKDVDENGVVVVSPMVADVNPLEDHTDAEIEIGITNNSLYPTQDIKVIGKIGFVGNTYQIGDGDLGSEFDVRMTDDGIAIPDALAGKVTIYYSDQTEPTDDIADAANNWKLKEDVTDFSTVKTYLIIVDDYTLPVGQKIAFTYDVEMPNTTADLNKKTYFTHGVYYNIVTDAGLLPSSVGGAKLGIRVSRRYDVNLKDLKIASDRPIAGSKYVIVQKDDDGNIVDSKILTTDENGDAIAKNLYAGVEYELTQTSVKLPFQLDEEVKKFNLTNNDNDELVLVTEGNYKSATLTNNHLVSFVLENETRYTVVLKNTDLQTDGNIEGSSFKITGKGYEDGAIMITNTNGEYVLKNLYVDERYTIEEIRNEGYLKLKESFIIYVRRNKETGEAEITLTKVPNITKITGRMYSNYCGYSSITGGYEIEYWNCQNYQGRWIFGSFSIDLTGFKEKYKLEYDVTFTDSYKNSYMYTWILDDKSLYPGPTNSQVALPTIIIGRDDYNDNNKVEGHYETTRVSKKDDDGNWYNADFMGGQKYDIVFFFYKGTSYNYHTIKNIKIKPISGLDEQVSQEEKTDVALVNNRNVLQSIQDSDNQDAPVLTVHIKSAPIPTYNLEINKVDAETGEPLAGAQYKVMGPGLPATGKYLTTDENGKATVTLYKKYNYDAVNDIDYSEVSNEYTIEEVIAPVGYMIDSGAIEFSGTQTLNSCNHENGVYNCDLNQDNITYIQYDGDKQFANYTFDATTNTVKATLQDYPIVKITKKDAETGEVLPNTLFAVYKVELINGIQVETPAVDPDGNPVGIENEINGVTYYLVATDQNGNLNLNLPAGQYKLKEIQAADEKYEVDTAVYYFGVGETVPYRAAGVELVGGELREVQNFYSYPSSKFIGQNGYYSSDGGYITFANSTFYKYDANGELEWETPAKIQYISNSAYYVTYDDKEGEYYFPTWSPQTDTIYYSDYQAYYAKIVESPTGGYYASLGDGSSEHDWVIKLDEDGNIVWQNTDQKYVYRYFCYGTSTSTNTPGSIYYRDENSSYYSCTTTTGYVNYLDSKIADIAVDNEGNLIVFVGYIYNYTYESSNSVYDENGELVETIPYKYYNYAWRFDDGTYTFAESTNNRYVNGYDNSYIIKYDKDDGHMYDVIDYNTLLDQGLQKYITDNNLNGTINRELSTNSSYNPEQRNVFTYFGYPQYSYAGVYDDGSMLFKMYYSDSFYYNDKYNSNSAWFIKVDPDGNVVYLVPTGVNGSPMYNYNGNLGTDTILLNNENGGFTYMVMYTYFDNQRYKLRNEYGIHDQYDSNYDTEFFGVSQIDNLPTYHSMDDYYGIGNEYPLPGSYIFEYNGQGIATSATIYAGTGYSSPITELLYGDKFYNYFQGTKPAMMYRTDDGGYILAFDDYPYDYREGNIGYRKIRLKTGEMRKITVDTKQEEVSYVMKIDSEGNIEWLRELYSNSGNPNDGSDNWSLMGFSLGNSYGSLHNFEIQKTDDGKLIMPYRLTPHSYVKDPASGVTIENDSDSPKWAYLEFELSEEVTPSGPEAYTLTLENERKQYKIIATSNTGGTITVTDPDGNEEVINNGTLETVKYGDDNVNTITIKPDQSHVVLSVTVNGEDASFKVNDDGSVTLNTIKDIRETKNVNVTYENGMSTVVVKHYLKDTTDSVFGDDIITGKIDIDTYTATPKSSYLYSLAEENGEIILPDNISGPFTAQQQTVIFYYQENEVELRTNYYIEGTSTELAPTDIQRKVIGSHYQSAPINITNYEYTRTVGDKEGTLEDPVTEVTHMYRQITDAKITVRYVDKDTNLDIVDPVIIRVPRGDNYVTEQSSNIPSYYQFDSSTDNTFGPANADEIEVIYYYTKIESTITVRYVDKDTDLDIIEPITKKVTRGSDYTTEIPDNIPSNYRSISTPTNASGPANSSNIEVIYYFEVIPFNISVDKKINSVLLNGEKQTITNGKNVSISPKKKDSLIVYYEIDVKNTGDIKATFKVVEGEVPGFVIYDQGLFTKSGNDYVLDVELEPGEEKTYKIGYKWNQKDYGISTNKVEVKEVENPNGFAEPDPDDNESTATVETKIPKEVLDDVVVIPNTIDNIKTIVMLFITSIIGIITSIILIRRKRMN